MRLGFILLGASFKRRSELNFAEGGGEVGQCVFTSDYSETMCDETIRFFVENKGKGWIFSEVNLKQRQFKF